MNHAKIAAALHALAEAFEGAVEEVKDVATGKGKKVKVAEAPAAVTVTAVAPVAEPAAPAPVAPSIDKAKLNAAVLKVAAKDREAAMEILAKFGAKNTVTLPPEQWQAVYDAFEEEIAKIDAAAVQVAQASLV
jgi:hypothetical protein